MNYTKCLSYPLPFYAIKIISHFLNSRSSANHDNVDIFSDKQCNGKILIKEIVSLLYNLFCYTIHTSRCAVKNLKRFQIKYHLLLMSFLFFLSLFLERGRKRTIALSHRMLPFVMLQTLVKKGLIFPWIYSVGRS